MDTEVELKLDLEAPYDVNALRRTLGLGEPRRTRLSATYFDTPDQALAKLGYSLRIRQEGRHRVQTIKSGGGLGAGLFARREWESRARVRVPQLDPDHPITEALGDKVSALIPRFEILTDRSIWRIEADKAVIELAFDQCEVLADGASLPFSEIELELKRGDESALFGLARRIARLTPVRLGVLAKAERAQRLIKPPGPSDKAGTVPLRPDMTAAEAFRIVVYSCIRQYRLNEIRFFTQDNAHALHQMRVALRRLRSALVTFRSLVKGNSASRLKEDLRWLTRELGRARNVDVLIPLVHDAAAGASLKQAREEAYAVARQIVHSDFTRELMLDVLEWSNAGDWTRPKRKLKEETARDYAAKAVARLHGRLMADAEAISGSDDERRHEARKAAKKVRYAVEFFALLFDHGKERKARIRYLAALEELQDHLGALNDFAVMPQLLAELELKAEQVACALTEPGGRDFHILQATQAMALVREAKSFWG